MRVASPLPSLTSMLETVSPQVKAQWQSIQKKIDLSTATTSAEKTTSSLEPLLSKATYKYVPGRRSTDL